MTVRECAMAYNLNKSTIHSWIQNGFVSAKKDEFGVYHIDEMTLPFLHTKSKRGIDASFRTIRWIQNIYDQVSAEQDIYDRYKELDGLDNLCSRGCEHIHRLRYCNYD